MKILARPALIIATLMAVPAYAQTNSYLVGRASSSLIRIHDPVVRGVKAEIPSSKAGCQKPINKSNKSLYCPVDRVIYIPQRLLTEIWSRYGSEGVATLVAREYAFARLHALQPSSPDSYWASTIQGIQAYCVAGVYLKNASPVKLSQSTLEKSAKFAEDIPAYMQADQGLQLPSQIRRIALLHGYDSGSYTACLVSRDSGNNTDSLPLSDSLAEKLKGLLEPN